MSLRLKALLSAVLLVAAVTGALGWYVRQEWEAREQKRITRDLHSNAADLRRLISTTRRIAAHQLELQMMSPDLKSLIIGRDVKGNRLPIRDNFLNLALQWKDLTQADVSLVTLDKFLANDASREARQYQAFGDLVVTAIAWNASAKQSEKLFKTSFLKNKELQKFLQKSYEKAETNFKSNWKIFPIANTVWLVVEAPFYADREKTAAVGQAVVFFELSDSWLSNIRGDLLKSDNPVLHVIYHGEQITGQTLGNFTAAQKLLSHSQRKLENPFQVSLTIQGKNSRYVALKQAFELEERGAHFIALKNLDAELLGVYEFIRGLWIWGIGLGLLGIGLAYGMAMTVVRRLDQLKKAANAVRSGDFTIQTSIRGRDEVSALGTAFNSMTEGLKALGDYTDPILAQAILDKKGAQLADGVKTEACIYFSDIRDFTAISESLEPEDLVSQLNEYFSEMGKCIKQDHGFVDKFNGDSVMAWWGPPFVVEGNLATMACRAALACQQVSRQLREKWAQAGRPLFHQRIGISFGEVIVGNLGSQTKKNFTVVGDTVNLASRLETANLYYGTEILACETTVQKSEGLVFREIDQIRVKGRFQPVRIFECLGEKDHVSEKTLELISAYEEALQYYRKRSFVKALKILEFARQQEDDPSMWLSVRCEALLVDPPGEDWESVTVYRNK